MADPSTPRKSGGATAAVACSVRPSLQTLSVIVPVLNEAQSLPTLLVSLRAAASFPFDIVVSDGGSTDGCRAAATRCGALAVNGPRGRGSQIAAGIAAASGELIVVAHADMIFRPGVLDHLLAEMNRTGRRGGCLGSRFDARTPLVRLIALLNKMRARWFGLSFGDQAQFVRRDALDEMGGFPVLPLMEDLEFALRLRRLERPLYLDDPVLVSARAWRRHAAIARLWLILRLVTRYVWRRSALGKPVDVEAMYARYYRTAAPAPTAQLNPAHS